LIVKNLFAFIEITRSNLDRKAAWLGGGTLFSGVVASCLGAASPLLLERIINSYSSESEISTYHSIILLTLCISTERLLQALSGVGTAMLAQQMNFNLGKIYTKSLINNPMREYIRRSSHEIVEILQTARNSNQVILHAVVGTLFPILVRFLITSCVLLMLRDWVIVLLIALYTIAFFALTSNMGNQLTKAFAKAIDGSILASRFLGDVASNIIIIKTFDSWLTIKNKYNGEQRLLLRKWTDYFKQSVKFDIFRITLFFILLTACLLKSSRDIADGLFDVGHFVLINAYIVQICAPIEITLKTLTGAAEALTGFSQFFEFARATNDVKPINREQRPRVINSTSIEFRNVTFFYDNKKPVLNKASLTIRGGQMLAVTGPTGSGKSTIVKLLLGQESPVSGKILINGLDITSYSETQLSSLLTLIPQETYIFNDTLAFNLRIAKPDASDDELGDAIETAQLTNLVNNLPKGLDSPIGDRGLMLSGGERQRVAFARAILRGSPIIIIDEGTSALDETTERKIIEALRPIPADRIVVMVAHRKAVIASADDVCIVNGGKMSFVTRHAQIIE